MMASRALAVAAAMDRALALDVQWQRKVPETDRRYTPFMPFSKPALVALVAEALPAVTPACGDIRFLAIGCGPGSDLIIARDVFGMDATGFDRVPEYTAAARSLGLKADDADAEHYHGYGAFQLTWFNRVARDAAIEQRIEARVWHGTAPGGVVIGANLEAPPPGWDVVLDDWEIRRGIWLKREPAAGW